MRMDPPRLEPLKANQMGLFCLIPFDCHRKKTCRTNLALTRSNDIPELLALLVWESVPVPPKQGSRTYAWVRLWKVNKYSFASISYANECPAFGNLLSLVWWAFRERWAISKSGMIFHMFDVREFDAAKEEQKNRLALWSNHFQRDYGVAWASKSDNKLNVG